MKKISIFVLFFAFCCSTHALAKTAVVKAVRRASRANAAGTLIRRTTPVITQSQANKLRFAPHTEPQFPRRRDWLTKYQNTVINFQRAAGISKMQAIRNVRSWGAEYVGKNPRPVLVKTQSFQTADLAGFVVPAELLQTLPPHPFQNQRSLIYRGLALDVNGGSLRNILENGILLKDVGPYSNTLLYSLSGPRSRSSHVRAPVINLTDNANQAVMWAKTRKAPSQICVVAAVESNQTGKTILFTEDIPAESVYALTALLMVDGKPAWCKVEWTGENFIITPYASAQDGEPR